jgi:SseB protein C-terminal domain
MIKAFINNLMTRIKDRNTKKIVLKQGKNIYLKVVDNIPKEIGIDFCELLKKEGSVEKAYLVEGFMESGEPIHYFIGIKFDKNKNQTIENFMTGISKEFRAIIPSNLYVDVIHLSEKDAPINNFIQDCAIPFYTRN